MAFYLFGSRSRGDHRPDSDIDIVADRLREAKWIPNDWLIENGGPVDLFVKGAFDWAFSYVGSRMVPSPRQGEVREVTWTEISEMVTAYRGLVLSSARAGA